MWRTRRHTPMSRKKRKTNYRSIELTESLWLSFNNPDVDLYEKFWPWVSASQWQLYTAGCCRRIERLMGDERSRRIGHALEEHAAGKLTTELLYLAVLEARQAYSEVYVAGANATDSENTACQAARTAVRAAEVVYFDAPSDAAWKTPHSKQDFPRVRARIAASATYSAVEAAIAAARDAAGPEQNRREIWRDVGKRERQLHCDRLREIVGNPFRKADDN